MTRKVNSVKKISRNLILWADTKYYDVKTPKIIKSDLITLDAYDAVESCSLELSNFEVEVNGRVFTSDRGAAYLGSFVQPGDTVTVKINSILPPEGYLPKDVKPHIAKSIVVKTPTRSELARLKEAESNSLLTSIATETQNPQEAADTAAKYATR